MLFRSFVGTLRNLSVHVSQQACHLYRHSIWSTVLPVVKCPMSHSVTQIPTGDIMSRQFCGNHPFLKISVITPGETSMSHGNCKNFQKWTILPQDTMCPGGICVTPWEWDMGNFTTGSTDKILKKSFRMWKMRKFSKLARSLSYTFFNISVLSVYCRF